MAVTFATEVKREGALYVDFPENILVVPELNGRHEHTDVEDLAADIAAHGQRTPVLIRKNDAGQPVLVYGHRRWRAVQLLNSRAKNPDEKLKLLCNYESLSDEEAFAAACSENRFRKDLTPVDDSHNILVWMNRFKKTVEDVARIYFPEAHTPEAKAEAVRWVKVRADLKELAPEVADKVRSGEIKVTAASHLAKLSKDQQRAAIAQSSSTVGGKARIKVKDVVAAKAKPPAKPVKASGPDPDDVPFDAPTARPAPLPSNPVLAAAETMARALDTWLVDATDKTEKALIAAYKGYRALVPLKLADGKAA